MARLRTLSGSLSLVILLSMVLLPLFAFPREAAAYASLSVSPSSGPSGASVVVTGSGFEANKAVTLFFVPDVADPPRFSSYNPFNTNGSGQFSVSVSVPSGYDPGPYYFCAITYTECDATASFTLTSGGGPGPSTPSITAFTSNPSSPAANQSFTLTATSSADVGSTPYWITIYDGSTQLAVCGGGTTCTANVVKSAGYYVFQARISDSNGGNIQSSRDLGVSVSGGTTPGLVDLETSDLYLAGGSTECAGDSASFEAEFWNAGSSDSGTFNFRWVADDQIADGGYSVNGEYATLGPGATDYVSYDWQNLQPGWHTLTFIVDMSLYGSQISEPDELNNERSIDFYVDECEESEIDLRVVSVDRTSGGEVVCAGTDATFHAVIQNFANETSPGFWVRFWQDRAWYGEAAPYTDVYIDPIPPGGSVGRDYQWSDVSLAEHALTVEIDPDYLIHTGAVGGGHTTDYALGFISQDCEPATIPAITAFTSSPSSPTANQSFTLTATASIDVGQTPYYITIYEGSTQRAVCGGGTTCTASLSKPAGTYTFQARVSDYNGGNVQSSQNLTLTVGSGTSTQRTIELDPGSGEPGTLVKVTGQHFLGSEIVYLYWDDSSLIWNAGTVRADGNGRFTAYFSVPGSAEERSHTVRVTDGAGSATSPFYVNRDDGGIDPPAFVTVRVTLQCWKFDTNFTRPGDIFGSVCNRATLAGTPGAKINGSDHEFEFVGIPANTEATLIMYPHGNNAAPCTKKLQINRPSNGIQDFIVPRICTYVESAIDTYENPFTKLWGRTDAATASGVAERTWMWGPEPFDASLEPYAEAGEHGLVSTASDTQVASSADDWSGPSRLVVYFDKSRMEITHPDGDPNSIWYVTNGLLVTELISGNLQLGDASFEQNSPAEVNVAGDADDPTGPTYRTFNVLRGYQPIPIGSILTQRVGRASNVWDDGNLSGYGVTAAYLDTITNHTIASVFWTYMNSSGLVYQNGQYVTDRLFEDPFYATGRPITEAYWATVKVGGNYKDVLIQCFERRCLTYTPGNDEAWRVEAGNVGLHYYMWRYGNLP